MYPVYNPTPIQMQMCHDTHYLHFVNIYSFIIVTETLDKQIRKSRLKFSIHTILELPKLDSWEFGANLSQTLLVAEFNKNLKL